MHNFIGTLLQFCPYLAMPVYRSGHRTNKWNSNDQEGESHFCFPKFYFHTGNHAEEWEAQPKRRRKQKKNSKQQTHKIEEANKCAHTFNIQISTCWLLWANQIKRMNEIKKKKSWNNVSTRHTIQFCCDTYIQHEPFQTVV